MEQKTIKSIETKLYSLTLIQTYNLDFSVRLHHIDDSTINTGTMGLKDAMYLFDEILVQIQGH